MYLCIKFTASRNVFPARFSLLLRSICKVHDCYKHIPNHAWNPMHCVRALTVMRKTCQLPAWDRTGIKPSKLGQRLARATTINYTPTTRDKHILTAFSQDSGCTLRGTVYLLKVTLALKKKKEGGEGKVSQLNRYCFAGKSFVYFCSSTSSNTTPAIGRVIIKSIRHAEEIFHWAKTSHYAAGEIV